MEPGSSLPYSQAPDNMMPPLETLPPPGDPSGGVFYLRIVLSPEEASRLWVVLNIWIFYGEELLAPRPTPKLEDHPLSAVRDWLFSLFAATLHIGGRSSIRNLRTRHAVVTGTHKHGRIPRCMLKILKANTLTPRPVLLSMYNYTPQTFPNVQIILNTTVVCSVILLQCIIIIILVWQTINCTLWISGPVRGRSLFNL